MLFVTKEHIEVTIKGLDDLAVDATLTPKQYRAIDRAIAVLKDVPAMQSKIDQLMFENDEEMTPQQIEEFMKNQTAVPEEKKNG